VTARGESGGWVEGREVSGQGSADRGADELVFRYPLLLNHGWEINLVSLGGLLGLWWWTVKIAGTPWYERTNLAFLLAFIALITAAQIRISFFALRQPTLLVFHEGVLEVRWRGRLARYRPEQISVGEVEVVPIGRYKGVRVATPDGPFWVTERLRRFDRFVEVLRAWAERDGDGAG